MSLYVTITRKPNPLWRSGEQIALHEWQDAIKNDPEFRFATPADIADSNGYGNPEDAIWLQHPKHSTVWFIWDDGQIDVNLPDELTLKKMANVAEILRAKIISEQGQLFDRDGTSLGLHELPPDPAEEQPNATGQLFESLIAKMLTAIGAGAVLALAYLLFRLIQHEWF